MDSAFAHHFLPERSFLHSSAPSTGAASSARCLFGSFDQAVDKGYVEDFGRLIKLNRDGYFPSPANHPLRDDYRGALNEVVTELLRSLRRNNVRAIFVRGSVASGNSFENSRSDLDLVVFTLTKVNTYKKLYLQQRLSSLVRSALCLGSVDIRYVHAVRAALWLPQFKIDSALRVILLYYATPIYGSIEDVGIRRDERLVPTAQLAIDICRDKRSFAKLYSRGEANGDFALQLHSLQWACKRCLRAVAELAALKQGAHARDLVPCYRLGAAAFPDYEKDLLYGLQIACACSENQFLNNTESELLSIGLRTVLNLVEIVEELSLREYFGEVTGWTTKPSVAPVPNQYRKAFANSFCDKVTECSSRAKSFISDSFRITDYTFPQFKLPKLEIDVKRAVTQHAHTCSPNLNSPSVTSCTDLLMNFKEPVVYRAEPIEHRSGAALTHTAVTSLMRAAHVVQCRVSPLPEVTFCREKHQWIENQLFTPPSVLVSIPTKEALSRLSANCSLLPLNYKELSKEYTYIQTRAPLTQRFFETGGQESWKAVQEERIWISAGGMVSSLHYDASHSALLQRCGGKRMIFFPPSCLEHLGVYPLGHPLHRRARVDLLRRETSVFQSFWKSCASCATEVILRPGDLLVFPPFWPHYTESITGTVQELCISHTFRYVFPPSSPSNPTLSKDIKA